MSKDKLRSKLRSKLYLLFGLSSSGARPGFIKKKSISESTPKDILRIIVPKKGEYPINLFGTFDRVPRQYLWNWLDFDGLSKAVLKRKNIHNILYKISTDEKVQKRILKKELEHVLKKRSIINYIEEAERVEQESLEIYGKAIRGEFHEGINRECNQHNAEVISAYLNQKNQATVLDIGCGMKGHTIVPLIELLPESLLQNTTVILLDTVQEYLKNAKSLLVKIGIPEGNIILVKQDVTLGLKTLLKDYSSKLDIITSGSAIHHSVNINSIVKKFFKLLKPGGMLSFWDFGHLAFIGPKLVLAPKGSKISSDGRVCLYGGSKFRVPGTVFISDTRLKAPPDTRYGEIPRQVDTVRDFMARWVSYFSESIELREKFVRDFETTLKKSQTDILSGRNVRPFNFMLWLKKNVKSKLLKLSSTKSIAYLQGHTLPNQHLRAIREFDFDLDTLKMRYIKKPVSGDPTTNLAFHIQVKKSR